MPDNRLGEDDTEGRNDSDYGTAGFGAGEVLGGEAARRQQEILTGSQYSANMPPQGYRPGFQPEYLYFGDPRYQDYAALLPGVYGNDYQSLGAPAPVPVGAPAPVPVGGVDPATGLPLYTGGDLNFSQADIENAMDLIISGQYDINSLASQLGVPQDVAYNLYNQHLYENYGVGAFDPSVSDLDDSVLQQYYGIADQYGYSPEQIARVFGTPLDRTRSYLTDQYFGGIPVDQDYTSDEAQQVYDLYASGRMGVKGISNYFGIPESEVRRILGEIEGAGGSTAGIVGAAPTPSNTDQSMQQVAAGGVGSTAVSAEDVRNTDRSSGAVTSRDDTEGQGVNPIATAMDLYSSGVEIPADQVKETLEYAQARGISYAQLDQMFGAPAGSAQDAAAVLGMAASAGGIVGMARGGKFPDLSGDGEVTQEDILMGRGVIEKAEGGLLSGIASMFEKEEEPKPQGGALLTETESYLEAQRILGDPDSSDRDKAFARGTLETLKPEQQGGNMDMNSFSEMMQQVDKILGATKNMQEGGYIDRDQLDSLISMTRDAILGDAENADQIIQAFISVFGQEAFEELRDQVLQSQVPDAQTEGMIEGSGGGMDDEVMGMIGNQQGVAVSPGEYIIPADVVSSLGDGSSDAGADKLDTMLDDVRMAKTGRTIQPGKIDNRVMPA